MHAVSPPKPPKPCLRNSARVFWHRVSEGLAVHQLWSQLEKDARSSYRLYSAGFGEREPGQARRRYIVAIAKALFWAIIEKLSPGRRILLLLALIFLFFFPSGGFTYTSQAGHIEFFQLDLHVWGGLLMFVVLLLELADRVVMKRDLEIARDIQAWLLPGTPLQLPGYQIAYATRPANTVAGDYYDVILRPGPTPSDERVLFVVADVAGKSIPAAMLMATFQASLRTLSTHSTSLLDLVTSLNVYACTNSQGGVRFTTVFFAELDPASGTLVYVNAGHNAPLLRSASGAIEHLSAGGLPIGILTDAAYETGTTTLTPGAWLVIYTDGVVEAVNSDGNEYEEFRLTQILERTASGAPADLLKNLLADLDSYVGNTPQHDDMTCLLLKRVSR